MKESISRAVWFCHNCGTKVVGIKRNDGVVVAECSTCHTGFARTYRGRHHKSLEIYTAKCKAIILDVS